MNRPAHHPGCYPRLPSSAFASLSSVGHHQGGRRAIGATRHEHSAHLGRRVWTAAPAYPTRLGERMPKMSSHTLYIRYSIYHILILLYKLSFTLGVQDLTWFGLDTKT